MGSGFSAMKAEKLVAIAPSPLIAARQYASTKKPKPKKGGNTNTKVNPEVKQTKETIATAKNGAFILEIIGMKGFAQPIADVQVRVSLCRYHNGSQTFVVLGQTTTGHRFNTVSPRWHSFREIFPKCRMDDIIQIEVLTSSNLFNKVNILGVSQCTVEETGNEQAEHWMEVQCEKGWDKFGDKIEIGIRRITPKFGVTRKRLYFIRHGESKWNRAQATGNFYGMLANKDHPLNNTGIQQSKDFNKRWTLIYDVMRRKEDDDDDDLNKTIQIQCFKDIDRDSQRALLTKKVHKFRSFETSFYEAEQVFSSPLSRALQTSLITLQGHPHVRDNGIKLLASIREIQNFMGKDSRGAVFGQGSYLRAKELLEEEMGKEEAEKVLKNCKVVDPYDTDSEWWINANTKESKSSVVERMEELINTIHYGPHDSVIVVGHSLFFRQFFNNLPCQLKKTGISSEQYLRKKNIIEQLKQHKIENCGCVGIELEFRTKWPYMRRISSLVTLMPEDQENLTSHHELPHEPITPMTPGSPGTPEIPDEQPAKEPVIRSPVLMASTITDVQMMFGSTFSSGADDTLNDPMMQST